MLGPWQLANPVTLWRHFAAHRYLLFCLVRREVQLRYHGSWLGPIWSLLTPLLMLGVYTFVFSVVFQSRWSSDAPQTKVDFALALFASLTAFNVFAETVSAAPGLILANVNYVKRVVFPLELLPLARLLSNLVQAGCGFSVFIVAVAVVRGGVCWTLVFLPLVMLPLALLTLGCAYFISSLGVFIRDISQVVGLVVTMLMFLSAVFYPLSGLPPQWQPVVAMNPLVGVIEDVRRVALLGLMPNWPTWAGLTVLGTLLAMAGLMWFMKAKNAFADVL